MTPKITTTESKSDPVEEKTRERREKMRKVPYISKPHGSTSCRKRCCGPFDVVLDPSAAGEARVRKPGGGFNVGVLRTHPEASHCLTADVNGMSWESNLVLFRMKTLESKSELINIVASTSRRRVSLLKFGCNSRRRDTRGPMEDPGTQKLGRTLEVCDGAPAICGADLSE
ncbi:uncharacterized protein LACBIDRAFT_330205 [Laccaria bicolor S238N-H82]|uniref:Predicted protein n=1 Tax=Laccaria bicolor (strain S238N-H82 / ATCC MYA-4686) TaxID=486041 RepID=B0DKM7_LACBS|nr:uncharacterized protein LACBIDRAFT_330205 [Laccaria bicolor S238N-H82]EDR05092.1 predicted protein [Laccaria bicolor S238N-H82]|eukprot:XP_001884482.1 predicted protein [Laccaria bicolor S238N-H82]